VLFCPDCLINYYPKDNQTLKETHNFASKTPFRMDMLQRLVHAMLLVDTHIVQQSVRIGAICLTMRINDVNLDLLVIFCSKIN